MRAPDYQRGDVTLYCGDCLEILPELSGVDAVVTDPPYGIVNRFGSVANDSPNGKRTLTWEWDKSDKVAQAVARAVAQSSSAFVFCGYDTVHLVQLAMRDGGMTPKPFVWIKQCPPPPAPGNWWPSGFELAVYAYRSGAWFGDDDVYRRNVWYGDSMRNGNSEKNGHPTQKPKRLMRHVVESIAAPGSTVIDPFMGSGTTGVACVETGRKFIGIEIERKYFDIAVRRIEEAFDQFSLLDTVPTAKVRPTDSPLFGGDIKE